MRIEIAVKIAIVGREDIGWSSRDANVLRRVGVARAGIDADAGKDFYVVTVHEMDAASGSTADKLGKVLGVNSEASAAGLERLVHVILKFLPLEPDLGARKQVNAAHVVPVTVSDDDVGDIFGLDAGLRDGFIRGQVILHGEKFEPLCAVEAAVHQDCASTSAHQPEDHGDVELFVLGRAHDQGGHGKLREHGVTNGFDGVFRRGIRRGLGIGVRRKNEGK